MGKPKSGKMAPQRKKGRQGGVRESIASMRPIISESQLLRDQEWAARLMLSMEPWRTLGRHYADCLQAIQESFFAVARDSNGPAGFILWTTSGLLNGYIRTIAVSPAHQGKGLGQALIAHAEAAILAQSPNVFLCVSSFNPRARALYERLGYRQVGRLENLLIPDHDEILLRKAGPSWREFRQTSSPVKLPTSGSQDGTNPLTS